MPKKKKASRVAGKAREKHRNEQRKAKQAKQQMAQSKGRR